jgi:hypothetical protein
MDEGENVGKLTAKVREVSDEGAHFHPLLFTCAKTKSPKNGKVF